MKESDFQRKLIKSLREKGIWAYKIPDAPKTQGARFIPEKPADIIATNGDKIIALIECKMIKGVRGINRNMLRSTKDKKNELLFEEWNQVKSLNNFPGRSYLALNIREKKGEKRHDVMILFYWDYVFNRFKNNSPFTKQEIELLIKEHGIWYKKIYDLDPT